MKKIIFFFFLFFLFLSKTTRAEAATLYFQPNSGDVCGTFTIDLMVDPAGANVVSVDAFILYDTAKLSITVNDILTTGSAFENFPLKNVDASLGKIALGAGITAGSSLNQTGKVATLRFQSLVSSGTASLNFTDFTPGATTGTGVAAKTAGGTSQEVLSAVVNASYTIKSGGNGTGTACAVGGPSVPTATPIPASGGGASTTKGGLPAAGIWENTFFILAAGLALFFLGAKRLYGAF